MDIHKRIIVKSQKMKYVPKGYNDFSLVRELDNILLVGFRFVQFTLAHAYYTGEIIIEKKIFLKMNDGYPKIDLWISLIQII